MRESKDILANLKFLLNQAESEILEKKSKFDWRIKRDILELIKIAVSMANTKGGRILIGDGNNLSRVTIKNFDSAKLDDKINRYIEPPIKNIVSDCISKKYILITIDNSDNKPHIFKKDGYDDQQNKNLFWKGTIWVRHSSKTEMINRNDIERIFEEKRQKLFENVKMVFEAPADAKIGVFREDKVTGIPVKTILDTKPFTNWREELKAGIKSWKTSGQLLTELQLLKFYKNKEEITDPEAIELLIISSLSHWMPNFYWASRLNPNNLFNIILQQIKEEIYPIDKESLKYALFLSPKQCSTIFNFAENINKASIQSFIQRTESIAEMRKSKKKFSKLSKLLFPNQRIKILNKRPKFITPKSRNIKRVLDSLVDDYKKFKRNKTAFKYCDFLLHAQKLFKNR